MIDVGAPHQPRHHRELWQRFGGWLTAVTRNPACASGDSGFTLLLSAASLVPRLYVAIAWAREPVWDGHYYDFGARRIAQGFGYSDTIQLGGASLWHPWCHYPVGYSGFLAAAYRLFGDSSHVATVANAVIGALVVALTHRVSLSMLSKRRARIAATACAVHPGLILYSALVMTELLSAFLALLALHFALSRRQNKPWCGAILAGIVIGLATLVSPPAVLLAPILGLALTPTGSVLRSMRTWLVRSVAVTAVALAVVAPWTYRNCRVMDGCAFVSTNGGWNLAIGAFGRATGRFETLRASDGCELVTGQVQQDRCWAMVGWQAIRNDPLRWLRLVPVKLGHCFNHESFPVEYLATADRATWTEPRRMRWREFLTGLHRLLLSASAFGCIGWIACGRNVAPRKRAVAIEGALFAGTAGLVAYAWSNDQFPFYLLAFAILITGTVPRGGAPYRGPVGLFVIWSLAMFVLVHAVFFGEDRYHIALVPMLCVLAAGALRGPQAHGTGLRAGE